jgi:hypothetical protein
LFNIRILFNMPRFVEEVIDLGFRFKPRDYVYLQWITPTTLDLTAGRLICMFITPYLLKYYCWKDEMVKHGKTMCVIVHHVIFPMWMAELTYPWYTRWFMMYVV